MQYILVIIILFIGVIESIRHRKLTVAGAIAGGLLGLCIFIGGGWTGLAMLALFFLSGTGATSFRRKQKAQVGLAQEREGTRTLGQVLANGGLAGILGILTLFFPQQKEAISLLMAGAFSSAIADTLSSELGTLYGKRFFNIMTLKKDVRGKDGVISWEGTLIGFIGSLAIAFIYSLDIGWNNAFYWILLAGTAGNLADSVLGATLERKNWLNNDGVNFLNTLIAVLLLYLFL